ncbi:hypothetical protein DPMN_066644 [Dreissena polymorpha]|uniref:EGF-like domain-containing protein n=1 Tax=Dreissena polymorpha TaxID=45954 RepID=A0A9D3YYA2_DREPO|nr:hypothetical protein DPMN_066644 [Dreissena polymorpha]
MQSRQLTMIRLLLLLSVTVPFAEANGCTTQVSSAGVLNLQNDIDATSQSPTQPASQVFAGGWCANTGANKAQLNVHFRNGYGIKGIIIYPLNPISYSKRVHVQYIPNGGNQIQEFPVPGGQLTMELNASLSYSQMGFSQGIAVTQLRFEVLSHQGPQACMKLELIGCPLDELCPGGCQNNGICQYEGHCACQTGWEGMNCELKQCSPQKLGLADGRIPASNILVSSQDPNHPKEKLGTDGWCPTQTDQSPWVQITLDKPTAVSVFEFGFLTRLQSDPERMFMREFNLQYIAPVDSTRSLRTFADNIPALNRTHYSTVSTNPVIVTDTIRIVSVSQEIRACFKLELQGCDPTAMCTANWCKNNGTCIGQNVCKCPTGYFGTQCGQTPNQIVATKLSFVNITNNTVITAVPSISFAVQGNVNLTAVPGKPEPVLTIQGTNVCIKMNVSATSASCITDIDLCLSGFTFAMDVSFKSLLDNTYIVSSGGNLPGHKGVALYYSQNHLYYIVSSSTFTWTLVVTYTPALNVWQHFEITWNPRLGVELLVNEHSLGTNGRPNPSGGSTSLPLAIACSHGQFAVNVNMMVTGIISWNFDRTMLVNAGIKPAPDTTTAASTSRAPPQTSTTTSTTTTTTAAATTTSMTPNIHSTTALPSSTSTLQLTTTTTKSPPQPTTTTQTPAKIPSYGWNLLNINHAAVVIGVDYNLTVHGTRPIHNVGVHLSNSGSYIMQAVK